MIFVATLAVKTQAAVDVMPCLEVLEGHESLTQNNTSELSNIDPKI
jgi:hypothetical protein